MSGAPEQLARLLDMIPYAVRRGPVPVAELAEQFGVTPAQVRRDLQVAWVCGLPGQGGGTLIDVTYVGDDVLVGNADPLGRPFTFTTDEALALTVALRGLADLRAVEGTTADAAERALTVLEAVVHPGPDQPGAGMVDVAPEPPPAALAAVRAALDGGRRLHLEYYSPYADAASDRVVDPVRLVVRGSVPYLQAWDPSAEGMRTFRLDRVVGAQVSPEPAQVLADAQTAEVGYRPAPDDPWVRLRLRPAGRWVLDRYVCQDAVEHADGTVTVTVPGSEEGWLRRLALRLGADAEIVEPVRLREEVRATAARALARYEGEAGVG